MRVRVAYVKQLAAGTSAGYDRAYMAKKDTWIATLPVGHADGWPRLAAKGGRVRINGRMYPVIASVSASHTLVEIGDTPAVKAGDVATLFDWEDGSRPEDVAAATGGIGLRPDDAPQPASAENGYFVNPATGSSWTGNRSWRLPYFRSACRSSTERRSLPPASLPGLTSACCVPGLSASSHIALPASSL